jgi:Putative restriction endonuclease
MATGTSVSLEEYLHTSYRPDCDYVDGELQERISGERDHNRLQREILLYLCTRYPHLRERLYPEQRMRVKATRFRVPDVCLTAIDAPDEQVFTFPPVLCIEILSPRRSNEPVYGAGSRLLRNGRAGVLDHRPGSAKGVTPGHMDEALDGLLRAGDVELPLREVLKRG